VRLLTRFSRAKVSSCINSKRQLLTNVDRREDFDVVMKDVVMKDVAMKQVYMKQASVKHARSNRRDNTSHDKTGATWGIA
jgi:hypothetical protein